MPRTVLPAFSTNIYEEIVRELDSVDGWDLDEILHWFRDDGVPVGEFVEFSHLSCSDSPESFTISYGLGGGGPGDDGFPG